MKQTMNGGNIMLDLTFYHNLPKKTCKECGCEMEEMHEAYYTECEGCEEEHKDI
jgi:hypothetical protein